MTYKILKIAVAAGIGIISLSATSGHTSELGVLEAELVKQDSKTSETPVFYSIPTHPLAAPPGLVPMIVYMPAQLIQPATIPPHTHATMAQTIEGTHCSINDVAVLTQDPPSCEKAGGKVVAERANFSYVCPPIRCGGGAPCPPIRCG